MSYVCVYTHIYVYIRYIYVCMYTHCVRVYIHTCVHNTRETAMIGQTHIIKNTCMHVCMYVYIRYIYVCMYVYTYICIYIHLYVYTYVCMCLDLRGDSWHWSDGLLGLSGSYGFGQRGARPGKERNRVLGRRSDPACSLVMCIYMCMYVCNAYIYSGREGLCSGRRRYPACGLVVGVYVCVCVCVCIYIYIYIYIYKK